MNISVKEELPLLELEEPSSVGTETRTRMSGPQELSLLGKPIPSSDKYLSCKSFQAFREYDCSFALYFVFNSEPQTAFIYFPNYVSHKTLKKINYIKSRANIALNRNEQGDSTGTLSGNK